jgi:hypothetical protein
VPIDSETITNALTGVGGLLGGLVAGALWVRKRISRDELEIDRDKRERHVMSDLMRERDLSHAEVEQLRAQIITQMKATADAEMRARLAQGDFEHLIHRYARLHRRAQRMADRLVQAGLLDPVEAQDLQTRFGGLDEIAPTRDKS